jgi:hypothetical protein
MPRTDRAHRLIERHGQRTPAATEKERTMTVQGAE